MRNRQTFDKDSAYYLLCSLEILDDDGNLKQKADMFTRRTIKPHKSVTHVNTASEALTVSIGAVRRIFIHLEVYQCMNAVTQPDHANYAALSCCV